MAYPASWAQRAAAHIKQVIEDSGLPDARIADLSGIPISTFHRRVRGVNPWTLLELESVAKVLRVKPRDLVIFDEPSGES